MNAPITIFCYNRPVHLEHTLQSLLKCPEAKQNPVYFFCDGPKNADDLVKTEAVREIVHRYAHHFDSKLHFNKKNQGLATSIISGVTNALAEHETVIVLEDDIEVNKDFLLFMNTGLSVHQQQTNICSVSGYLMPIDTSAIQNTTLLLPRASSWGWATWKDRWFAVDWDEAVKDDFLVNKRLQKEFGRWGGEDLIPMMKKQLIGKIDSWLVRWAYHHFKTRSYCLFPKESLAINRGNDGSGTHSPKSNIYQPKNAGSFKEPELMEPTPAIDDLAIKSLHRFLKPSPIRKVINFFTLP